MGAKKAKRKKPQAGMEWCITNAQRELFEQGRKYPFDEARFHRYVTQQIHLFRRSIDWQALHRECVRRYLAEYPLVKLRYWQAASSILFDAIWETFWKEVLVPEAENS